MSWTLLSDSAGASLARASLMTSPICTLTSVTIFCSNSQMSFCKWEAPQILKFQRPDWALFRTVEGLRRWRDKAHAERKRDAKPEATP